MKIENSINFLKNTPWTFYALLAAIILFITTKSFYLFPRFSDGNVYLYLAQLISQGALPYRDFFYSSPPLIPYLYSIFGLLFGFTWQAFSYIPVLLTAADAVIIYFLVANLKHDKSNWGALAAGLLYLFSYTTLATTDFVTDVHLVTTLTLLSILAHQNKRPITGGVFLALAIITKLYAVIIAPALLLILLIKKDKKPFFKFTLALFLTTALPLLLIWLTVGQTFYEQLILSHFGEIEGISKLKILKYFLQRDWLLVTVVIAWLFIRKKTPAWIILPLISVIGFFLLWHDFYFLYFKLFVALLALWWGWSVTRLAGKYSKPHVLAAIITIGLATIAVNTNRYISEQSTAAVIEPLDKIVNYTKKQTEKDKPIFGSFEVTPLLAVSAKRKIWQNHADTNSKFFQTGWFDQQEIAERIKQDKVPLIITKAYITNRGQIALNSDKFLPAAFFRQNCEPDQSWKLTNDYSHNAIIAWQCNY